MIKPKTISIKLHSTDAQVRFLTDSNNSMDHIDIHTITFINISCCLSLLKCWVTKTYVTSDKQWKNIFNRILFVPNWPSKPDGFFVIAAPQERDCVTLLTHNAFLWRWGDDVAYVQVLRGQFTVQTQKITETSLYWKITIFE